MLEVFVRWLEVESRGNPRAPGLTLRQALGIFVRQRSFFMIALTGLMVGALRLWWGRFGWFDLALVVGLVLVHPLTEWLIHVFVLHFRPRAWGRVTIDFRVSRDHRSHHRDPHDPTFWYIPIQSGVIGFLIISAVAYLLMPRFEWVLTTMFVANLLGLVYEWTHYLCHTSYRPRSAFYRRIWRHHRLHHFKNEHYWMGVTMHAGDRLMGTRPDVRQVETSPTCRSLLEQE